uniref:30S ribosomal protein S21 n=1 Tax=Globodera pallida TaxID=36090 RepID=A0A183CQ82_GLOPA
MLGEILRYADGIPARDGRSSAHYPKPKLETKLNFFRSTKLEVRSPKYPKFREARSRINLFRKSVTMSFAAEKRRSLSADVLGAE